MTALEKAARTMCLHDHGYDIWDDQAVKVCEQYRRRSRATIESLRTPGVENTDRIFNAMLDRILKGEV